MIAPLAPYGLKGVLWYQGESNVHEAGRYPDYLRELVEGWRAWWKDDAIAFYLAQLADYIDGKDEPPPKCHSPWSELREAQTSILRLPHTGLAVTRDVGDAYDIHPRNKQDVGFRLALQALKNLYGLNLIADGPKLESTRTENGKIILKFANCEQGLRTKNGGPLVGFDIGDRKGAFFIGKARITGPDKVEVESPEGIDSTSVRYAWASFSLANLENSAGLPTAPFRAEIPQ
jgi:sialate O-acetylesterase